MDKKITGVLSWLVTALFIAGAILYQTGIDEFTGPGDPGAVISFAKLREMRKDKASDGERISLLGRFRVSGNVHQNLVIGGRKNTLVLNPPESLDVFELISLPLEAEGKNSFFVPAKYRESDAKFFDNSGTAHAHDALLKVSFTLKRISEAEPEMNPSTGEYVWEYAKVRLDPP